MTNSEEYWHKAVTQALQESTEISKASEGYELISDGLDRHGALEWTYHEVHELDHYVNLSLVDQPNAGYGEIELRISATGNDRSVERFIGRWPVSLHSFQLDPDAITVVAKAFAAARHLGLFA